MDIQIKLDQNTGHIEKVSGADELDMELSMGLSVECLELNTGQIYLVEMVDGQMIACSISQMA
jgi:hypothetical protein